MCRLGRLASLALEVDELSDAITSSSLNEKEELMLAPTLLHLRIAMDRLEQAIYDADRLDMSHLTERKAA